MVKKKRRHYFLWTLLILAILAVVGILIYNRPLPEWPKTPSYALQNTDTSLYKRIKPGMEEHPGQNGFMLLESGLDAFAARMALIQMAESSLDLQYYMWHGDDTGQLLVDGLIEAADRGVRVRLLVDDLKSFGVEQGALNLNAHPNIEVRFFNPFRSRGTFTMFLNYLFELGRMDHRMHNKVFVADNIAGVVGGRNIGDEYFEAKGDLSFNDLDFLFAGPIAQEASKSFDAYWNSPWTAPADALFETEQPANLEQIRKNMLAHREDMKDSIYVKHLEESSLIQELIEGSTRMDWAEAIFLADPPEKVATDPDEFKKYRLTRQLVPVIEKGKESLYALSPYFVPREEGTEFFTNLSQKGWDVRILTNSLISTDVGLVHSGYAEYRKPLLEAGIDLYELKPTESSRKYHGIRKLTESSPSSLHAKTFVVDGRWLFVGSMNLDPRSVVQNTEAGIVVDSPTLSQEVMRQMKILSEPENSYQVFLSENYYPEGQADQAKSDLVWVTKENDSLKIYEQEPHTDWWDRATLNFYGFLPLEGRI